MLDAMQAYAFSSFIILASILFSCIVLIGLYVLLREIKALINRLFFIKCLSLSLILLFSIFLQFSKTIHEVEFWYKLMLSALYVTIAISNQFYITIYQTKSSRLVIFLMYIPVALVSILLSISDDLFSSISRQGDFWVYVESYKNVWLYLDIVFTFSYPIITIIILYRWWKTSSLKKEKNQAKILIYAVAFVLILIQVFDWVLTDLHLISMPRVLPIAFSIYIFALFFVLQKYRFLSFDISGITREIIANVQDIIIILNPDKTIIASNSVLEKLLQTNSPQLIGKQFESIIEKDDYLLRQIAEFSAQSVGSFNTKIQYTAPAETIICDSYVSIIVDKFGDFNAVLIVSKVNRGIVQFKEIYKLSSRQLEIVMYAVNGLANVEIAEKLHIARRTVETHLFYVYGKLGINNKVELIRAVNKFIQPIG